MTNSIDLVKITVKKYISETTFSENSKLQDNTLIFKEGFYDSMGFISLISFLEETYSFEILDSDLVEENFESISAIVNFISKKKALE